LKRWIVNLGKISKPDASIQIAQFILEIAAPEEAPPKKVPEMQSPLRTQKKNRSMLLCDFAYAHQLF